MVDFGDSPTVPGYHLETLERIEAFLRPVHEAGVVPLCLGGDHSMVLAELRAAAAVHGPLALVHLDAHADVWDQYYGVKHFHGTVFKRAVEEGLDRPGALGAGRDARARSTARPTSTAPGELGYDALSTDELLAITPAEYGDRVRARVGDAPAFLSFDVDFVDPAFAPGTGTPEVGGPTQRAGHGLPARAHRHRLPRLRLRRGVAAVRRGGDHRVARGQRVPRDAVAARAARG